MKKFLFSLVACSVIFGAAIADDKYLTDAEIACINSSGAILSAAKIANLCIVWPVVSHLVANGLNNTLGYDVSLLGLCAGVSVGLLTAISTEHVINLSVLKNSKRHGAAIISVANEFTAKHLPIPMGLIGFLALMAAL
jgi:hypothetical protein